MYPHHHHHTLGGCHGCRLVTWNIQVSTHIPAIYHAGDDMHCLCAGAPWASSALVAPKAFCSPFSRQLCQGRVGGVGVGLQHSARHSRVGCFRVELEGSGSGCALGISSPHAIRNIFNSHASLLANQITSTTWSKSQHIPIVTENWPESAASPALKLSAAAARMARWTK